MTLRDDAPRPASALWSLLANAVDYAGLFPPAQLDMPGAVAEYESYLRSGDAWALGRFVVAASRLDELATTAADAARAPESLGRPEAGRGLSAVLGADLAADIGRVAAHNAAHDGDRAEWWAVVEAVEFRATTPQAIADALQAIPATMERFVEIPIADDLTPLVRAIAGAEAYAKVRTGGTTPNAFPASADLARFLATCVRERVAFKATAGLHHPLRGEYPLTYEPGSACGSMYGFLNVFLATAFLSAGGVEADARRLLEEHDPAAVRLDERYMSWRGHRIDAEQLAQSRTLLKSFGSCSFREPIDDLTELGLL